MRSLKQDGMIRPDDRATDGAPLVRPAEFLNGFSGEFDDADMEHAFRTDRGVEGKKRAWGLFIPAIWLLCDALPAILMNAGTLPDGPILYTYVGSRICVVACAVMMVFAVWQRADYRQLDQIALPMLVFLQIAGALVLLTAPTLDIEDRIGTMTVLAAGFFLAPFNFRKRLLVSCPFGMIIFYRFTLEAMDGSVTSTLLAYWAVGAFLLSIAASRMFRAYQRTVFIYRQIELSHVEQLQTANRQLQTAHDEAAAANQMKTHFVASTAHDLRNPLNAILGFSEIIESQIFGQNQPDRYREAAADIHTCVRQMLHQIESLLDAATLEARPQKLHLEPVDVQVVAASVIRQARASSRNRDQNLSICIPGDLPGILADRNALHQILINLVSNAQKFTQEGGNISIAAERNMTETIIRVIDNGSGIPENQHGKVTDRFTVGRSGAPTRERGWGLGLSIVDALARAHGGRLELSGNNPRGTVASIYLPLSGHPQAMEE